MALEDYARTGNRPGGTTQFLRADGTWAVPPSGSGGVSDGDKGDVLVSSSGTVWTIDSAVLTTAGRALIDDADASAQRTTLGLAAIASSGSASDLASGTVPSARLGGAWTDTFFTGTANTVASFDSSGDVAYTTLANVATSGSASDLGSGTLAEARLPTGAARMEVGEISTSSTSSNSTWTAVTGSSVTMEAGRTYTISYRLRTYSAAATTGLRVRTALAGGAAGSFRGTHYIGMSNATAAIAQSSREGTVDPLLGLGNATSTTTAAGSYWVDLVYVCTTGGTLSLEIQSEVNTSAATINGDGSYWVAISRAT